MYFVTFQLSLLFLRTIYVSNIEVLSVVRHARPSSIRRARFRRRLGARELHISAGRVRVESAAVGIHPVNVAEYVAEPMNRVVVTFRAPRGRLAPLLAAFQGVPFLR